jgi:hypothetical protein
VSDDQQVSEHRGVPRRVLVILVSSLLLMLSCCGGGFALSRMDSGWLASFATVLLFAGAIATLVFVVTAVIGVLSFLVSLFRD